MTYAPAHRAFYDADSHIMELPDFLRDYADPELRDQIPPVNYSASIVTDEEVAVIVARGNRHSDEHKAELRQLLDAAGLNGAVDVGSFRRYGSARKLYNFHVDHAGAY